MTQTEIIAARIEAILAAAGLTVRDDTDSLYGFENKPCIVIDIGDELADNVFGQGFIYWNLNFDLLIGADGENPKLAPEPTRKAAHEALYADRQLGLSDFVVDLNVKQIQRAIDVENPAAGITRVAYQIKYRVQESTA
ncbi:hypothetical protein [Rugamonas sp.]|uniref:hypothetical protein n=1 Tax=Rugamonas sp. TaxID=1926287 RepID=UPI0025FDA5F1|nr:hypothetical protein [Rugamonas sp.]